MLHSASNSILAVVSIDWQTHAGQALTRIASAHFATFYTTTEGTVNNKRWVSRGILLVAHYPRYNLWWHTR